MTSAVGWIQLFTTYVEILIPHFTGALPVPGTNERGYMKAKQPLKDFFDSAIIFVCAPGVMFYALLRQLIELESKDTAPVIVGFTCFFYAVVLIISMLA